MSADETFEKTYDIMLFRPDDKSEFKRAIRDVYTRGRLNGIRAAAGVLRQWAAKYPTSVFPEDSDSIDSQSAAFARHLCREIETDILRLEAPAP